MAADGGGMTEFQKAELRVDAGVLREFRATAYSKTLMKYVEGIIANFQERALSGTKEEFDYYKGAYHAARDVARVPETIIALAGELKEEKR